MAVVCSHYSERLPLAVILMIRSSNCHLFWRRYPTDISSRVVDYMCTVLQFCQAEATTFIRKKYCLVNDTTFVTNCYMYTQIENFKRVDRHWQGGVMLFCPRNFHFYHLNDKKNGWTIPWPVKGCGDLSPENFLPTCLFLVHVHVYV